MNQNKTIKVVVSKTGESRIEMDGFHGVGCSAIAEALARTGQVLSEENKPEFYESANVEQVQTL